MIAVDLLHVEVWGTYVTTPIVQPHYAQVRIRTALRNTTNADQTVTVEQVL